jgi:hypothetical protein
VAIEALASGVLLDRLEAHRQQLGGQGVNLFRTALAKSKSDLLDAFIRPHLITPDRSYVYIAEDNGGKGSRPNYDPGNTLVATTVSADNDLALPGIWGLFTNPLRWTDIDKKGPRPSDRAVNIGFCVYTLEFDRLSLGEQLQFIWGGGLSRTDKILQRFKDYRGHEVVYGGRKSLHFHFVFDLRHWNHDLAFAGNSSYQDHWLADFPDTFLREVHEDRWDVIARAFRVGTKSEAEPDPSLRFWEQNRRLPLALRRVEEGHPLGLPVGSYVRQFVLSSSVRQHIPRRGKGWFHHSNLEGKAGLRSIRRHTPRKKSERDRVEFLDQIVDPDTQRFHKFLAQNLPKLTPGPDLRYASVEFDSQGPTLHLYNSGDDQTPSSVIRGDHTSVLLQGRHDFEGQTFPLGVSPNRLYEAMVEQACIWTEQPDHLLDRIFEAEVYDPGSYRRFLTDHITAAMASAELVLILGPEGCGKSSAVMANIDQMVRELEGPIFISSPSYAQSAEKMRSFTAMHAGSRYEPFEYLSLTELYQRHCPLGERISEIDALDMGRPSWLATIYHEQPDVYAKMRAHRDQLHDICQRGHIPILFGVHETVRRHADTGMTRLFYAKRFDERWFDPMPLEIRRKYRNELRYETALAHVVLDEVSPADLVIIHGEADVRWAHQFRHSVAQLAESDKLGRYYEFQKFRATHPCPLDSDCAFSGQSDWQFMQEILHADYTEDDLVQLNVDKFPFDDDAGMYKERLGDSYYVKPRGWWSRFVRTTLLTTELVPAQIIEAFRPRSQIQDDNAEPDLVEPYRVFRFDRPGLFKDVVYVENHRDAKRETLPRLVEAYTQEFPGAVVISDMLKDRVDENLPLTTHLSARGSNGLDNRDILSFYTAPSPGLFTQLASIDARLGTRNTIALWYVDRFNQTSGRNRGFRSEHNKRHIAVMSYRMYKWLAPYLVTWSRYAFPRRRCSLSLS